MNWKHLTIITLAFVLAGCTSGSEETREIDAIYEEGDSTLVEEVESDLTEEHSLEPAPDRVKNPVVDSFRLKYSRESWENTVLDFIESDKVLVSIALDKIPFEGEELPDEATRQLQNLSDISMGFPYLNLEIGAHTNKAENNVDRTTKKATSKARALWVATKLNLRGVPNERLSSKGFADEHLIESIAPDDKRQKRIEVVITKVQQ